MSDTASVTAPERPRNPCPVIRLDTPRTRAINGMRLLREMAARRKRRTPEEADLDRTTAEICGVLTAPSPQTGGRGPVTLSQARTIFSCSRCASSPYSTMRAWRMVYDFAAYRARRAARAS